MIQNEKFIIAALDYIQDHLETFGFLSEDFEYENAIYDLVEVYEGLYKLDDKFNTGQSWG